MEKKNDKKIIVPILIAILTILVIVVLMQGIILSGELLSKTSGKSNTNKNNTELLDIIEAGLKDLRDYASYIEVQVSEDNVIDYVYNTKGEALSQQVYELVTSDDGETQETQTAMQTVIYKTDGQSIVYDQYISTSDTLDFLSLLELVLQTGRSGLGVVTENSNPDMDNPDGNYTEVNIDIRSYANITNMYNKVSEAYAYNEVEAIRNLATKIKSEYTGLDIDNTNIRFTFLVDKQSKLITAVSCWLYFGTQSPEKVTYDSATQLFASWVMAGHHVIDDWELDQKWYDTDWTDVENWDDLTEAEELLTNEYENITKILSKHFESDANNPEGTEHTD